MVRLTADLIWKSPHFFNAIKERELDLRGEQLSPSSPVRAPYFLGLGFLTCIWNEPLLLASLILVLLIGLSGNKIAVMENLGATEVSQIRLLSLSLSLVPHDAVTRLFYQNLPLTNWRSLKFERSEAERLFASKEAEEEAKKVPPKTFTPGEVPDVPDTSKVEQAPPKVAPTLEQITAIKALKLGQIPEEFMNLGKETTTASGDAVVDGMDTDDQNEVTEAQDQEQNEEAQPIEQVEFLYSPELFLHSHNDWLMECRLIILPTQEVYLLFSSKQLMIELSFLFLRTVTI
ncbi:hypothetical protein BHM03_00051462 [Ensete ventricosum]|nr:hypothetical protein BHM03_00051462 [Ensete ventricosum]